MIVEFSVKNFRSIRELQTLSFVATGLKSKEELGPVDNHNIVDEDEMRLLKTVGIYGANASGKSNIIRAFDYFIQAIKNEASSESNLSLLCDPFIYQDESDKTESFFQIVFVIEQKKFRYGFTVKKNSEKHTLEARSKEIITNEWLYGTKEKNVREYFLRTGKTVSKETLPSNEKIPPLQFDHTLFLTHASAFDSEGVCFTIRNFFKSWTISNFSNGLIQFRKNSLYVIEQEQRKTEILNLMASFNLKYVDIFVDRDPNKPSEVLEHDKIFVDKVFTRDDGQDQIVRLNLHYNESAGTQKLFDIAGLLLRAFNLNQSPLIILDEVDSNFHPALLVKLITLFNDPEKNKSHAQLLFTSHDTNLMKPSIMRRDQFYFTEKIEDDSTRLYSLADLKGIRNDADFAKHYLAGVYGALPMLSTYKNENCEDPHGTLEI